MDLGTDDVQLLPARHHPALLGHAQRRHDVVARDHDDPHFGHLELVDDGRRGGLEPVLEHNQADEGEARLELVPGDALELEVLHAVEFAVGDGQDAVALLRVALEDGREVMRN